MKDIIFISLLLCVYASNTRYGGAAAFLAPSHAYSRLSTHCKVTTAEQRQEFHESILCDEERKQLEQLVEDRARARWEGNYSHADMIRDKITSLALPHNWQVVVTDIPRKEGGGSTWELVETKQEMPILEGPTVLQLAHAALGLAVESSVQANLGRAHTVLEMQKQTSPTETEGNEQLDSIVEQVRDRFRHTNWTDAEMAGRKAADAAFWFALAGVTDQFIFESLADVATRELDRFGARSSCRAKDIYQIMERFSAAGLQEANQVEDAAKKALMAKGDVEDCDTLLDLHSDRSLLLIWKFSTKQKKQRAFLQSALKHWQQQKGDGEEENDDSGNAVIDIEETQIQEYDWNDMFKDPSRPLVIDVGCGMGVSLLGLASGNNPISSQVLLDEDSSSLAWKDCNFVGMDLGALGIGYARGLASRWSIDDRLQFIADSAESCLQNLVQSYPGPIKLCLIQFPTPYALKTTSPNGEKTGNSQLPSSARDGFMVTEELLRLVHQALSKSNGKMLLQSNCEDVAVYMRGLAMEKADFEVESTDQTMPETMSASYGSTGVTPRVPQRMADWIAMGGERAEGDDWSKAPILHRESATETEVACALNGTPVHRCLLRAVSDQSLPRSKMSRGF